MKSRRKNFSFAAFLCAVALCAVSGCTKFEAANPSANTTAKSAEECADSDEDQIHFQWKWCGPNVAGTAEIATVCRGTLYFQDMIFEAIKFENADRTKRQCLFNIGGGTTVTRAECMRAVEARYFPMYDESAESIIVECFGANSKASVDGESWNSSFHAVEP